MNCMYLQNLVRLASDNTPEIFWNGNWIPICGHDFWNTNSDGHQISVALFCQKLGIFRYIFICPNLFIFQKKSKQ